MKSELFDKIDQKTFIVGVVGLGYVGLPALLNFVEHGYGAIGFDSSENRMKMLEDGHSYLSHIESGRIRAGLSAGLLQISPDFSRLAECDGIIITVPTPLTMNREPDLSHIISTSEIIARHLRKGQLIILESTSFPGTTDEVVVPILEGGGLKVDKDFWVAYSPEREDPNNQNFSINTIPRVVSATTPNGLALIERLFQTVIPKTIPVSSVRTAEASKLLENIFRSVNIALVNELKMAFMKMDIDIWEVIEAAKTKPFGYMPFYPGPGLGGHCIPVDPFYLSWKAREYGVFTKFIELAGEINTNMPSFVVRRVMEALSDQGLPIKAARILILGLAYKANIDDDRESPSYQLMEELEHSGAIVSYNDPHIRVAKPSKRFARFNGMESMEISADFDLFLIATGHDEYTEIDFSKYGVPTVDTRNILKKNSPLYYKA